MSEDQVSGILGMLFVTGQDPGWQGRVLEQITEDVFLVLTYEWMEGDPHFSRLVKLSDMLSWDFFVDASAWREHATQRSRQWNRERSLDHLSARL